MNRKMNNSKNSYISLLEQIALLNANSVEIISKLSDVVGSPQSSISVNFQESDGSISNYMLPSVGYLKRELDIANSNIKKLAGLQSDNSVVIIDGISTRKVQSVDINREPKQIQTINTVTTFGKNNNWFFEGLMNPLLSVQLDLSTSIQDDVKKILSRRYIVKFDKNVDGTLTTAGQTSLTDFTNKFLNRNNFTVTEFLDWLTLDTNVGVLNRTIPDYYMDEQMFDLNFKEIQYKGYFNVMKIESDKLNNKLWYHLNTLDYYAKDSSKRTLAIGDVLTLSKTGSFSKYKILEINTSSSLFRISIEIVEGYDPIPVGSNVLEYYSNLSSQKTVNVSVGFDEYDVIFVRPINTESYIIGSTWSKGMSFYTNDLVLDTDSNVGMNDYYINNVADYGALLNDLVKQKIPTTMASTPNKPTLNSNNFKVVQTNTHLTDSKDNNTLKKLHSQKNSSKAKLNQIQEAITEKTKELNTAVYSSVAEKSKSQNELQKLISSLESETKLYSSINSQITNSVNSSNTNPLFSVRGFWNMPDPIIKSGYKPQEVIGFEIQYRYSSKFGTDNKIEGFNVISDNASTETTAYFTNWISLKTDIRKRSYDSVSGEWYWVTEDISNADVPNINQLDIELQANEKVEIKIRSISEVGYPDSLIMSDWCDSLTMEFPEELKDTLGQNKFIMDQANQDQIISNFDSRLSAKGITQHVQESFYVNEKYVSHTDKTIQTSFKDSNGNALLLFDYLKLMNDKISALEETIKRAKGELKVKLFKGTDELLIDNASSVSVTVYCDDYAKLIEQTSYNTRSYENNIYCIQDYFLEFKNISKDNPLGFVTKQFKDITNFENNDKILPTILDNTGTITKIPWTKSGDVPYINLLNGKIKSIYDSPNSLIMPYSTDQLTPTDILVTNDLNFGGKFDGSNIMSDSLWFRSGLTYYDNVQTIYGNFGATIHPSIEIKDISASNGIKVLNANDSTIIPISIYFKLDVNNENGTTDIISVSTTSPKLNKKLMFYVETETGSRPFQFELDFKLIKYRQFSQNQNQTSNLI
jgi:hypothetical protein